MNRDQFIEELKAKLKRLPPEEIESAISYYEEYFDEAGFQNEAQAIASLGSPSLVASKIIGEYAISDAEKPKRGKINPLLITVLAVCASPIALPIILGVLIIVISIFIVFLALVIFGMVLAVAGVASVILSFWAFTAGVATGIFYLGSGIFMLALGLAMTLLIIKLFQLIFRGLQSWLGRILVKKGTVK